MLASPGASDREMKAATLAEGRALRGRGAKGQPRAEPDLAGYAVLGRLATGERGGHPSAIFPSCCPKPVRND